MRLYSRLVICLTCIVSMAATPAPPPATVSSDNALVGWAVILATIAGSFASDNRLVQLAAAEADLASATDDAARLAAASAVERLRSMAR